MTGFLRLHYFMERYNVAVLFVPCI